LTEDGGPPGLGAGREYTVVYWGFCRSNRQVPTAIMELLNTLGDGPTDVAIPKEVRKQTGSHYTPSMLARFVAKQICCAVGDASRLRALDPAVGDAELLLSLLMELETRAHARLEAVGYDTNATALGIAGHRLKMRFPHTPIALHRTDFLDATVDQPNLFGPVPECDELFDAVIANPPYVRTQVLGSPQAQELAKRFGLEGRVDLYHAFIEAIARVLRPGGVAGIIVSNRFMTTRSGAGVRTKIRDKFEILHVWDLGDTKLFEAAVLPAVLLLRRRSVELGGAPSSFTSIYSTDAHGLATRVGHPVVALEREGLIAVPDGRRFLVRQGILHIPEEPTGVWRISTPDSDSWLRTVAARTHAQFKDIGKIRVGVKTTADDVFVRSDWDELPQAARPELLRPLTTHHIARRFKADTSKRRFQILYPHRVVNGRREAVKLADYPRSARYLTKNRSVLEARTYVIEAGRQWYEIWVPQDPDAWRLPKLVFRDIADVPTFWVDTEGTIVNGDCYWLTPRPGVSTDLLWLAVAVGNSSFIEAYYDHCFHNKLYAGRRRFMTQYVETFPLPESNSSSSLQIIELAKSLHAQIPSPSCCEIEAELNRLVWRAFGLPVEEIVR